MGFGHDKKKGTPPVPAHECWWYPISFWMDDPVKSSKRRPVLYACGWSRRCIKTMTHTEYTRKRNKPEVRESHDSTGSGDRAGTAPGQEQREAAKAASHDDGDDVGWLDEV